MQMVEDMPATAQETRCGFVALIGAPNAGKSTLINALVRSKVSIVSHKVQTTRMPVRGITIEGASQLIFVDTPGIFAPKRRLDRAMVTSAWAGAKDADLAGLLIDARKGMDAEAEAIVKNLSGTAGRKFLVLNKVDVTDKPALLALATALNERVKFQATFMVSALTGDGVDAMRSWLAGEVAAGAVALSRRPDVGCAAASARGRDHTREDVQPPASGTALPVDGRDRGPGRKRRTGRFASSRPSMSSAKARRRS